MQALLSLWTSLFGFALGSFFSKLLPLSSHSCPLLLLSWFPLLLSFLSFVVLGGQLHPHLHVTWLFFLQFPCSHLFTSVIFTPLFPKFHLLSLLSSSLTKSPPALLLHKVYSFFLLTTTEFALLCFSVVVAEEGAFHSIKCKMFFKRDSSWSELGIGMLNLKKLEGKTQVLVRNDTTLGKILLNIYLADSTPITRSGKNNVILMCVPNPPLYSKPSEGDNSKPATYLIRVKTAEDADELFSQLNKSKSSSNWYFYSKLDGSEKTEKFTVWLKGTEFFFQIQWWLRENLDNQNHFILQSNSHHRKAVYSPIWISIATTSFLTK